MTNEQLLTIIFSIGGLVLTATIALAGLILAQSRALRSELREGLRAAARERATLRDHMENQIGDVRNQIGDVRNQIGDLRDRTESQNSDLRDRLGRIEGYLDWLRQFFLRDGRGTAA